MKMEVFDLEILICFVLMLLLSINNPLFNGTYSRTKTKAHVMKISRAGTR